MKIKKRTAAIIALALLFALLTAAYFIWIRPIIKEQADNSVKLDLLDGEIQITDKLTTFYIFEPIPRSEIKSIEVENEYGGYKLTRDVLASAASAQDSADAKLGDFKYNGYSGVPFDDNKLASLVVTTGTPVAMMRVAENLGDDPAALAEYGLDEPQASWTLTRRDGKEFSFIVGDELLTEGGYYVKYTDRDAVYIVSTTLRDTILADGCSLLSPNLVTGLSENNYFYIDTFAVMRSEDLFVMVERNPRSETLELKMSYPRPENNTSANLYSLNEDLYFDVLYTFINLKGENVAAFMPTDEELEAFGLADPGYVIMMSAGGGGIDIFISEKQENGKYYAASSIYGYAIVCEVPGSTFAWLEKPQFAWIEEMPFYVDITTVSRLRVKGYGDSTVDLDFSLKHSTSEEGYALLDVTENNTGKLFPNDDVANFRKYYMTLMNITNQEYASLSDEDKALLVSDETNLVMEMTYENTSGELFEYRFYKYYASSTDHLSGGKMFVTVNGVGEFYTTNDLVEKALSDAVRVMNGLDIDSYGHN